MINLSKELIGNEKLIQRLIDSFNSKTLSNSIILTGEKGLGKSTLTFNFINKFFTSLSPDSLSAKQMNLIYKNSHPNIKYVTKELDSKNYIFR